MAHKVKTAITQFFRKFSSNFRKIYLKFRQYFCVISIILWALKRIFGPFASALGPLSKAPYRSNGTFGRECNHAVFRKFSWNFRKIYWKFRQYFCVISIILWALKGSLEVSIQLLGLYRKHPISSMEHKVKKAITVFFGKFSRNFRNILGKLRQYFCVISLAFWSLIRLFVDFYSGLGPLSNDPYRSNETYGQEGNHAVFLQIFLEL